MNVATFVIFRILLLGWMTRWLTLHRDDVPIVFFTVGSLGLATIVGMNIVLFYRILLGDYLGKSSPQGKEDSAELKDASCDNHAAADACEATAHDWWRAQIIEDLQVPTAFHSVQII